MNYIINLFIRIYEYITCVKSSTISESGVDIDELLDNMEYHIIYNK